MTFEEKIFNIKPILENESEVFCPKCNGHGMIKKNNFYKLCRKCFSRGKLDWVKTLFKSYVEVTINSRRIKDPELEEDLVCLVNFHELKTKNKFITKSGITSYCYKMKKFINKKIQTYLHEILEVEYYSLYEKENKKTRITMAINAYGFWLSGLNVRKYVEFKIRI